ncbi:MAG TPA: site-specific integrase [Solirubrobacteraceae bacterium]|nr:site-specific integrase [Solirubrobacteraceae bacterium]
MNQQGQVFKLESTTRDGGELWAFRYRSGGRGSKRIQKGGFASEQGARTALERELETLRRRNGLARTLTLAELAEQYLDQHEASPVTLEKLRWLLQHAIAAFGSYRLDELRPEEIAAWRMTIRPGYRFEATQALRQVLACAVVWGMLDVNPAKQGVENPQRRRTEKRPFESWAELEALAGRLGPRLGSMVIFAAATGMRPGEWVALEWRDVDRDDRVAYVRRSFSKDRLRCTKTEASARAVPLQARALEALDRLSSGVSGGLLFPAPHGGYLDLHNFRNRDWKPAQHAAGIEPFRRIYDLRHTFATFALRAGISTFELSRYMGASLTMIDRHYGHLARDGREHSIQLLDQLNAAAVDAGGRSVDAGRGSARQNGQRKGR